MSDSEQSEEVLDDNIQPLAFQIAVAYLPTVVLDRKTGLTFAEKLSIVVDPRLVRLDENQWEFSQPLGPESTSRLIVSVDHSKITITANLPSAPLERFETQSNAVIREFAEFFNPKLLLETSVIVRNSLKVAIDARKFLVEHVTGLDVSRLAPLGRPLHLFGLRMFMPPVMVSADENESKPTRRPSNRGRKKPDNKNTSKTEISYDWMINVKAESLMEDPSKLFLEAEGTWTSAEGWTQTTADKVTGRIATVSDYIRNNLIPFLKGIGPQ